MIGVIPLAGFTMPLRNALANLSAKRWAKGGVIDLGPLKDPGQQKFAHPVGTARSDRYEATWYACVMRTARLGKYLRYGGHVCGNSLLLQLCSCKNDRRFYLGGTTVE